MSRLAPQPNARKDPVLPLANTADMLRLARTQGYAVPGFEPYALDQLQATAEAAEEEKAPIILQLWSEVMETWGITTISKLCLDIAAQSSVPMSLHLDHCIDEDLVYASLDNGFTSVMYDGSRLPYEENVKITARVVERARSYGAAVEAELGLIRSMDDYASAEEALAELPNLLTPPEQADDFVKRTGIDILAPAIGSIHGCKLPLARLDIPRVEAIAAITGLPLALHGGSGVSADQIQAAIGAGVAKVNIDAEVRTIYIQALRDGSQAVGSYSTDNFDLARFPRAVKAAVREAVRGRIRMCGANGRA